MVLLLPLPSGKFETYEILYFHSIKSTVFWNVTLSSLVCVYLPTELYDIASQYEISVTHGQNLKFSILHKIF